MAYKIGGIELFRDAPFFGADQAVAALAVEGGAGRLDFSKFFDARGANTV